MTVMVTDDRSDIGYAGADVLPVEHAVQNPRSGYSWRARGGIPFPPEWGDPPSKKRDELRLWIESKLAEGRAQALRGNRPSWLQPPPESR